MDDSAGDNIDQHADEADAQNDETDAQNDKPSRIENDESHLVATSVLIQSYLP